VVLTTFHRSKGLQWHTVLILGLSTGLMPIASAQTPEAIGEERRLLYVALTRAEEELWCSWSESDGSVTASGSPRTRAASPWLAPIERAIAQLSKAAAPTAASDVPARVAELRQRLVGEGGGVGVGRVGEVGGAGRGGGDAGRAPGEGGGGQAGGGQGGGGQGGGGKGGR
jgi:hypothetical protein